MIIRTHYKGATNDRGSVIIATQNKRKVTVDYPYHLSGSDCHKYAAMILMGEPLDFAIEQSTNDGYVFTYQ